MTLGQYGVLTLEQARTMARDALYESFWGVSWGANHIFDPELRAKESRKPR